MDQKKSPLSSSRRKFIEASLSALAGISIVPRRVLGGANYTSPSDQITVGYIGTGKQGRGTLFKKFIKIPEVQIVAACDVDTQKLSDFTQMASAYYAENRSQKANQINVHSDFRELLERKDVDAVIIVTPDHWHATASILACEAGKDVYCEKPLSLTVKEGRDMVKATRKHQRVFQTGSMQRSWEDFHRAAELVINGYIGDIERVVVSVGGPPDACEQPAEPVPSHLDWNMWQGPAPKREYSSFFAPSMSWDGWPRWRYCKYYGGGLMTDWGAHMFDIAQWALGKDDSGPVEVIPDGKEYKVLTYLYEDGTPMVREDFGKGNAIRFEGSEGVIEVSRQFLNVPENLKDQKISDSDIHLYKSRDHYRDWLDAIRQRSKPICDVEVGHRTATVCNIGNIAYELNRPLRWNPKKEKFKGDREANQMLSRKQRDF
ncbi:Gfo/Idh/MocA family protein [Tunicatimonas pelagia]|uniref:Gfo/Idh/MocA family protein n=1 Tax=Tunicatimonas pelagia TaxID=931531 RepID=UPI002665ABD1|nr:Gfo/Idh/MocA family oxidoreductase [Tunicatimonas pelagia]WKN40849.1 Gfo/Idh/MocA family oxidoreductase [Tunicatimonas pelagia]